MPPPGGARRCLGRTERLSTNLSIQPELVQVCAGRRPRSPLGPAQGRAASRFLLGAGNLRLAEETSIAPICSNLRPPEASQRVHRLGVAVPRGRTVTFPPKRGPAADTTVTVGTREWQAGTTIPPMLSGPHKILHTERPLPQWALSGRGYFYSGFPNSRIVDCGGK